MHSASFIWPVPVLESTESPNLSLIMEKTVSTFAPGDPQENGPVVVPLAKPSGGDPGASSGCVPVSQELADALRRRPHHYYVNVHTTDFPGGAARGQLGRKQG